MSHVQHPLCYTKFSGHTGSLAPPQSSPGTSPTPSRTTGNDVHIAAASCTF